MQRKQAHKGIQAVNHGAVHRPDSEYNVGTVYSHAW